MRPLLQNLLGNRAASLTLAASLPLVGGGALWINSRSFFGAAKAATNLPRVFMDIQVRGQVKAGAEGLAHCSVVD